MFFYKCRLQVTCCLIPCKAVSIKPGSEISPVTPESSSPCVNTKHKNSSCHSELARVDSLIYPKSCFFFFKLLFIISWSSVSFWRVYAFPPEQHAKPQLTLRRGKQFANDVFNPGSALSIQFSFFFHMSITICGTCLEQWMSELHLYSSGLRVCYRGRTSRPLFK